jgi:saccharopine dehydrogenase-like NADP-dependent oxidoreductase
LFFCFFKGFPTLSLEHLPNRDSLPYGDIYGISDASQIYRGTLRYAGWSLLMEDFRKIGLTTVGAAEERGDLPTTWGDLMSVVHSQGEKASPEAQRCLQWLGCYSDAPVTDRSSILNAFCALLQEKLAYEEGERDMVLMQHEFGITYDDERPDEVKTSSMLLYGEPHGDTAMAKTVGLTIAVGAELVLGGAGKGGGILIPTTPELYNPGLDMLAKEGLIFNEQTRLT